MAGLFSKTQGIVGGKYLVQRRDGTVPQWPWFVLGAADPHAPAAILFYADACERGGLDPQYVADLRQLANDFEAWRQSNGDGDPDAPRHRTDDPATVAKMSGHCGA